MRQAYSFRTRVLLSFWIILLGALLLPPWYYFHTLTKEITQDSKTKAVQQLNLFQWVLEHESGIKSAEDLQRLLVLLGQKLDVRLTYVADGGKVIADSQVPFADIADLENHASRPEIIQSRNEETGWAIRYSKTLKKELMYTAGKAPAHGELPAGVLRLASPLSSIKEPVESLKVSFFLFVVLVFAAAASVSYLLIRRLNRPVQAMIETAQAISSRDYDRRIKSSPGQEFFPLTRAVNTMADSIQKHIRTITEQKHELEAVFDAMQEGVMVLDARGKIRRINRTFAELTSDVSEVLGRRPLEVIPNPDLQNICDKAMKVEEDARPQSLQIVLGGEHTYNVSLVWLPDEKKGRGAVAVFHDITELKRLEKVRRDFVANVSHELRTPLTSIKGYSETLLSEPAPDRNTAQSFLQVILKNTNHMVKMVEDLLQLARLEAPNAPASMLPVNAAGAFQAAWRSCQHQSLGKDLKLDSSFPQEAGSVMADFDQLVQVFRNLLENAIRYSPPRETLRVSCTRRDNDVLCSVCDQGPGITKKHQQRIFERFYRVDAHRGDDSGSTGLGLAICRHIIRNHGGKIWVQSPNSGDVKGSTFFFTLRSAPEHAVETANGV